LKRKGTIERMQNHSKTKVCYYYDSDIGNYYYGQGHPMKPQRMRMTHCLLLHYGLYQKMEVYRPHKLPMEEMTKFHTDDYIRFLRLIKPDNLKTYNKLLEKFKVGSDCPVFDGLYDFCQLSSGGSLASAVKLNKNDVDITINWSGGLHHAKKSEASGFCYVNDIVIAILELLKYHQRVVYIDIDVHHGDGVEEAFFTTDRVMTVSFHKFGEFFPGTGDLQDVGSGRGKFYSLNFPLRNGIDDASYERVFVPVMSKVMERFQPSAIVLQCGADSLSGDRLGCFNLSLKGHGKCVEFMKSYNLPLMLLGGGGYTIRNVARCWTYETSLALGLEIPDEIPYNDFFEYYGPDFKLHIVPSSMTNFNTPEYLDKIRSKLLQNLKDLPHAPGVQMADIPEDSVDLNIEDVEMDASHPDERNNRKLMDARVEADNEFEERGSENRNKENYGEENGVFRMWTQTVQRQEEAPLDGRSRGVSIGSSVVSSIASSGFSMLGSTGSSITGSTVGSREGSMDNSRSAMTGSDNGRSLGSSMEGSKGSSAL